MTENDETENDEIRFKQIAVAVDPSCMQLFLFGLTESGLVYQFYQGYWVPISMQVKKVSA